MSRSKAWSNRTHEHKWRALRLLVLERDHYQCQIRGPHCTHTATQVDHLLGKGVSEKTTHLRASCMACNLRYRPPTDPAPTPNTNWT